MDEIKKYFEHLYGKYNTKAYIATDPIYFPHEYEGNREFIAFTAAIFAYGNVKAMQKFLHAFFTACGTDPLKLKANPESIKYRFQSVNDVINYCKIMKKIYTDHNNLEVLFQGKTAMEAAYNGMQAIRSYFGELSHGLNFLFAVPGKSASKRLMMFFRWMIRRDAVDFGLWNSFTPADLSMPLDVHIERLSRNIGIITSEKGIKALGRVDSFFKELTPEDPAKYDFCLTRLGIATGCKYGLSPVCASCGETEICLFK